MKNILAVFLTILLLLPVSAMGEILTVTHTVKQTFGGGQSPDDARISGIALAKREALEKAGTYIESLTVVQNSKVEKDEILALTAGVLKAEVVSQKNYHTEDAFGMEIVVNVVVDTSVLEKRVKKLLQDKTHLTQLKNIQKREKELLQKVAQLEEENSELSAKKQSTRKLKKEFQKASQGLTAVAWVKKATEVEVCFASTICVDPIKAIEYSNNAIKLQPDYALAYIKRGNAYESLGKPPLAIKDYNKAIILQPDDAAGFEARGGAYVGLGQIQNALDDYSQAIRLKPKYFYYSIRATLYCELGQYQLCIGDLNEALRLGRLASDGNMHFEYLARGIAYFELGQYQRAIEDYTEAIRLMPDFDRAYNNRGLAYLLQNNTNFGCRDAQKACALGDCKVLEYAKNKGLCQ